MSGSEVSIWPKKVRFGVGAITGLPEVLAELGCRRAVVLCGNSAVRSGSFEEVRAALGAAYGGTIGDIKAHTPLQDVQQAAQRVLDLGADAVVSLGGGSVIDAGKGVILQCASGGNLSAFAINRQSSAVRQPLPPSPLRHICVPTTAGSGSDVMPTAGLRDAAQGRKIMFWDNALIPDATILDPRMAVHAGPFLTAASGMTVVARAMEALYSRHRNPISTGLALQALRLMVRSLPKSIEEPHNLAARGECQLAAVMASVATINAMSSVVHAIGHVVGGKFGLQHGVAHSILLGTVARRFAAAMQDDGELVLDALGAARSGSDADLGERLQVALDALRARLPLPGRLRDIELERGDIPDIARRTLDEYMMQNAPAPMNARDLEDVLESVW